MIMNVFCYVSKIFLCAIFLTLSKKLEPDPEDDQSDIEKEESSAKSIEVQSFDAEAELQARIWNTFVRNK